MTIKPTTAQSDMVDHHDVRRSHSNCSESEQQSGGYLENFSNTFVSRSGQQKEKTGRALTKWKRNGARALALAQSFLKKTRRPQPRDRISYWLPPENPTGHRKAQSCVTQMHEPHRYPQLLFGHHLRGGSASLSAK
jgi:hypothetical protein